MQAYKALIAKNGPEPKLPGITLTNDQLFFVSYAQVSKLEEVEVIRFVDKPQMIQIWCGKYNEKAAQRKLNSVHSPGPVRLVISYIN